MRLRLMESDREIKNANFLQIPMKFYIIFSAVKDYVPINAVGTCNNDILGGDDSSAKQSSVGLEQHHRLPWDLSEVGLEQVLVSQRLDALKNNITHTLTS